MIWILIFVDASPWIQLAYNSLSWIYWLVCDDFLRWESTKCLQERIIQKIIFKMTRCVDERSSSNNDDVWPQKTRCLCRKLVNFVRTFHISRPLAKSSILQLIRIDSKQLLSNMSRGWMIYQVFAQKKLVLYVYSSYFKSLKFLVIVTPGSHIEVFNDF